MANDEPLSVYELEENLSEVDKPPELPAGTYEGEIQDVQDATSAAGNPYWAIRFRIPPEEIPAEMSEYYEEGAVLTYNFITKPQGRDRRALYNLKQFIRSIGLDPNVTAVDPNEWMGRTAKLVVKQRTVRETGELRANIVAIEMAEAVSEVVPIKAAKPAGRRRA